LSNQPNFGARGHGRKTQLTRHHFDYTAGIVAIALDAPVDVTGAVNGKVLTRVGRSHRREQMSDLVKGGRSVGENVDRFPKSERGDLMKQEEMGRSVPVLDN